MAENNTTQEELKATEDNQTQTEDKKKDKLPLIKKALIIAIAALSVIFIAIMSIFIFKGSDETNEDMANSQTEQNIQQSEATQTANVQEEKEFKFDFNNLKPETLNEQLALLTNKNMQMAEKEKVQEEPKEEAPVTPVEEVAKEETKEEVTKQAQETEDSQNTNVASTTTPSQEVATQVTATNNQETPTQNETVATTQVTVPVTNQDSASTTPTAPIINPFLNLQVPENSTTTTSQVEEVKKDDKFLKLINVARIEGNLTKRFFDSVVAVDGGVLLCRDDENLIELYYGPFLDDEARDMLYRNLRNSGFTEAYTLELTKEEFDKRCNY